MINTRIVTFLRVLGIQRMRSTQYCISLVRSLALIVAFCTTLLSPGSAYAVAAWDIQLNRLSTIPVESGTPVSYTLLVRCSAVAEPACTQGQIAIDWVESGALLTGSVSPSPVIESVIPTASGLLIDLIDNFPAGATVSIPVEITAPNGLTPDGYSWTVDAEASATNTANVLSSSDGSATATAELQITKFMPVLGELDGQEKLLDQNLTYYLTPCDPVTDDTGDLWFQSGTLIDTLPDEATFVSASPSGVYSAGPPQTVTWALGALDLVDCSNIGTYTSSPYWVEVNYASATVADGTNVTNSTTVSATPIGETVPLNAADDITHSVHASVAGSAFTRKSVVTKFDRRDSNPAIAYLGMTVDYPNFDIKWRVFPRNTSSGPMYPEVIDPLPCLDNATANGFGGTQYSSNSPGVICANPAFVTTGIFFDNMNTAGKTAVLAALNSGWSPQYITNLGATGSFTLDSSNSTSNDFYMTPGGVPSGHIIAEITWPRDELFAYSSGGFASMNILGSSVESPLLAENDTLFNNARFEYSTTPDASGIFSTVTDSARVILIENNIIKNQIRLSPSSGTALTTRNIIFSGTNASLSSKVVISSVLLPAQVDFSGITTAARITTYSDSAGTCSASTLSGFSATTEVIENYNGTGRTLIRATSDQAIPPDACIYTAFDMTPSRNAPGSYSLDHRVYFGNNTQIDHCFIYNSAFFHSETAVLTNDADDWDGDGDVSSPENLCPMSVPYTVNASSSALFSEKAVQGDLDSSFQGFPNVGSVSPGGSGNYQITLTNNGAADLTNVVVYDILPHIGDTGVSGGQSGSSRLSAFDVTLTTLLGSLPAGATANYSNLTDPCRPEVGGPVCDPAGTGNNDWSSTPPTVLSAVRAFKVTIPTITIGSAETFSYSTSVPAGISPGDVAWNSFAVVSNEILATEPPKVGLGIPLSDLSVDKTVNGTTSAVVGVGDTVTFELTVQHDTQIIANADGSVSYVDENGVPTGAVFPGENVVLTDLFPTSFTVVSTSGHGSYDAGTHTWTVGDVYPGQSFTMVLTATADALTSAVNSLHITSNDTDDIDSTPDNWTGTPVEDDEDEVTITVVQPGIDLQKQVEETRDSGTYIEADASDGFLTGAYSVGEPIRYRFVVTNLTALALTGVVLSDPLIDGFCDPVTLDIGNLAGNASVTVDCEWPIGFADTSSVIVNTATITANYNTTPLTDSDDAQVQVSAVLQDMGDLPSGYPTLFSENGPRHVIVSGINLGGSVDDDSDGIATAGADGDDLDGTDDEDGVSSFPAYSNSGSYFLSVAVTNTSAQAVQLVGWVDFGTGLLRSSPDLFGGTGDAVDGTFTTANIPAGFGGNVILQWSGLPTNLPTSTSTTIYARFRLTSDPSFLSDASPAVDGPALDGEVEDYVVTIITTPITLGYFHAHSNTQGELQIDWQTVTETAHLGFNVYVKGTTDQWKRLNSELILPASPGDSFETREYQQRFNGVRGRVFALGDVDVHGKETLHGPFKLNQVGGVNRAGRSGVDWQTIKSKRKAQVQQRQIKRKQLHQKRIQKKLNKTMRSDEHKARRLIRTKSRRLNKHPRTISPQDMDRRHEQLEQENEQCEEHGECAGSKLGDYAPIKGDPTPSRWSSRFMSGLFSLFIPVAYAVDVNEPELEPGVMYIQTEQTGVYRVTHEELVAGGIDLAGLKHTKLSLTNHGEPVFLRSWGQKANSGDKRYMGPGGGFEFVAQQHETLYSKSNVYELHIDKPEMRRVIRKDKTRLPGSGTEINYYQHTYRLEPDIAYATGSPNGDPWFAAVLGTTGSEKQWAIPFELDHYAPGYGETTTALSLWGYTSGSHQVSIAQAGQKIDERYFQGIEPITLEGALTGSSLQNGLNTYTLTISGRGETDYLGLDAIEVDYPRFTWAEDQRSLHFKARGDIIRMDGFARKSVRVIREQSDGQMHWIPSNRMQRNKQNGVWSIRFAGTADSATYYAAVTNAAYRLKAALQLPVNQPVITSGSAQYLVVSHPDFIDSNMDRLIQARRSQGYRVKVADVEAIYTHFGHGHFGAQPIRDYIAWAKGNLGTEMVLLVGDDMFDYHQNNYTEALSFIPSIYAATGPLIKIAPVDAKYVDFDDDDVPDIPIGRLTPRTTQDWSAMVDKTLMYANHPNPASIVLSADRYDMAQQYDFTADSTSLYSQLPAHWQSNALEFYIDDLGVGQARSGLLDALNTGPSMVSFVGHSGPRDWSFEGLLKSGDIANLTNYNAPIVVTQWGCWNTYYASPNGSLANAFLSHPQGGAAGVLGAISLTQPGHEREFGLAVYENLLQSGMTLGQAVLDAKQSYARQFSVKGHRDILLGMTLLADPALVVPN